MSSGRKRSQAQTRIYRNPRRDRFGGRPSRVRGRAHARVQPVSEGHGRSHAANSCVRRAMSHVLRDCMSRITPGELLSKAGGRARREYERRLARDKARARAKLPYVMAILILVGPVTYALSRAIFPKLLAGVFKGASFTPRQTHEISLWIAVIAFLSLATEAFRRRSSTDAFRIGAEGEERIGGLLDKLERHGYHALHDVPLRGYGNIDHLVVGPGGVFTVETKNAAGKVRIRAGQLKENGRRREEHIAQARRQVEAVRAKLAKDPALAAVPVTPLLCYARASAGAHRPRAAAGTARPHDSARAGPPRPCLPGCRFWAAGDRAPDLRAPRTEEPSAADPAAPCPPVPRCRTIGRSGA